MLDSLKETIIADAFEKREIVNGMLAERLIRERQWAAAEIERLRAALESVIDLAAVAVESKKELDAVKAARATLLPYQQSTNKE